MGVIAENGENCGGFGSFLRKTKTFGRAKVIFACAEMTFADLKLISRCVKQGLPVIKLVSPVAKLSSSVTNICLPVTELGLTVTKRAPPVTKPGARDLANNVSIDLRRSGRSGARSRWSEVPHGLFRPRRL